MKRNIMNNTQLELGLTQSAIRITVRQKRASRAKWWFSQMRQAVDSAIDWTPSGSGRPEQIQLIRGRQPSLA